MLPINRESSLQLACVGHTTNPVVRVLPVPSPAHTRDGRVGLRDVSVQGLTCSGEDGNHVFGECPVAARLLALSTPCSRCKFLFVFLPAVRPSRHPLCTAPSGMTTATGTMSLSGATGFAAGYDLHMILNHPLKFLIKTLLVITIYMMYSLLVDMFHMMFLFNLNMLYVNVMFTMNMMFWFIMNKHLITTIFIVSFYWIKLNLKLPIFFKYLRCLNFLITPPISHVPDFLLVQSTCNFVIV
jgi:hypothetical protein